LVAEVKRVTLSAYAHQDIPFEKLVEELQPQRDLSRQPLFQVTFSFQNFPSAPLELSGLHWRWLGSEHQSAKVDLSLYVNESDAGLSGMLEYATDLFDRSTIERMVRQFERVLTQVVADERVRVNELDLLSEAERRQMTVWNATAAAYPGEQCIHQVFEEQARCSEPPRSPIET
jgi:non-ribosomal peptide synthetase component F